MNVGMWMSRDVVSIDPAESINAAATLMATRHVRRLPVAERRAEGPHLIGIVTSRDLFRASPMHVNPFAIMAPENLPSNVAVSEVMQRQPITTVSDAPIEEPARAMCAHKIGGIPVVDKGVLVGIITESDIFRAFVSMMEAPSGSVRITFSIAQTEDIFSVVYRLATPRKVRVISMNSAQHHDTPVCVVRLTGGDLDAFVDDVWKSGHHVKNVLRIP